MSIIGNACVDNTYVSIMRNDMLSMNNHAGVSAINFGGLTVFS